MPWRNMATNTSDIAHLSDSDDSDYQYEVQNLAYQVIHFMDNNNVTSSDNESLNNDSSDNESVDSENGQNGNGNCMQIPISSCEQDTEHENRLWNEMGMDISFGPWVMCWTFPWKRNAAHGLKKEWTSSLLWSFVWGWNAEPFCPWN